MIQRSHDDFVKESQQYERILQRYKESGEVYVDPLFHPTAKIPENHVKLDSSSNWDRIDDYYPAPLFQPDLINSDFILQGNLENCHLAAAFADISNDVEKVKSLFDIETSERICGTIENSINLKCGAVVIKFHAFGKTTPVLVDTFIHTTKYGHEPFFIHPSNKNVSPWFCLVEKAFAKLFGSYSATATGNTNNCLYYFLGYIPVTKTASQLNDPGKLEKKTPFTRFMKYWEQGCSMSAMINELNGTVTPNEIEKKGLLPLHAYQIKRIEKKNNIELICMRNPWGEREWNGDYCDDSPCWTPQLIKDFNIVVADDGIFWMNSRDFFRYFTQFDLAIPKLPNMHYRHFCYHMRSDRNDGLKSTDIYELETNERPHLVFQITERLPLAATAQLHFLIERQCIKNGNTQPTDSHSHYNILISEENGYVTETATISLNGSMNNAQYSIKRARSQVKIALQRTEIKDFTEICHVTLYCKHPFDLYNYDDKDQKMPEGQEFTNEDEVPFNPPLKKKPIQDAGSNDNPRKKMVKRHSRLFDDALLSAVPKDQKKTGEDNQPATNESNNTKPQPKRTQKFTTNPSKKPQRTPANQIRAAKSTTAVFANENPQISNTKSTSDLNPNSQKGIVPIISPTKSNRTNGGESNGDGPNQKSQSARPPTLINQTKSPKHVVKPTKGNKTARIRPTDPYKKKVSKKFWVYFDEPFNYHEK